MPPNVPISPNWEKHCCPECGKPRYFIPSELKRDIHKRLCKSCSARKKNRDRSEGGQIALLNSRINTKNADIKEAEAKVRIIEDKIQRTIDARNRVREVADEFSVAPEEFRDFEVSINKYLSNRRTSLQRNQGYVIELVEQRKEIERELHAIDKTR